MKLTRKQWMMLVVLVLGAFVTVLNQTLVTPALPSIMTEMNVDQSTAQWLTTGFTLVNAIMIPITAFLQDRFSTRKLFVFSMSLFAVGTLLAAVGLNFPVLLGGRLVQAAGAGILMPVTMTVLMLVFPVDRRGSAMGIFGLVIAFAPAIGPTVAGFVIDQADWHILFYLIFALSIVIIVPSLFLVDNKAPANKGDSVLDPLSLALSTLGFGLMLYGFSALGSAGFTLVPLLTTALGIVGVVWFFIRQTRLPRPMLRVDVLKNRRFLVGTIIGMLVQGALLAAGILMPIYVQSLHGLSATVSGLVLMPGAILMGIMNPLAGKWFDRHGPRRMAIVGMSLLTLTTFAFAILNLTSSIIYITIVYTVRMFSMSLVNMPITTWGMNALDNKVMNHGTSVNNTLRQVAGSLGTAIIIAVSTQVQNIASPGLGATEGTMLGINAAFLVCTVLCLVGLVMTIALVKDKPGGLPRTPGDGQRGRGGHPQVAAHVHHEDRRVLAEPGGYGGRGHAPVRGEEHLGGAHRGRVGRAGGLHFRWRHPEAAEPAQQLVHRSHRADQQHRERRRGLRREAGEGHADARQRNWRCQPHLRERAREPDRCVPCSVREPPEEGAGAGSGPHRGHHQPQRHHPVLHGRLFGRPSGARRLLR